MRTPIWDELHQNTDAKVQECLNIWFLCHMLYSDSILRNYKKHRLSILGVNPDYATYSLLPFGELFNFSLSFFICKEPILGSS